MLISLDALSADHIHHVKGTVFKKKKYARQNVNIKGSNDFIIKVVVKCHFSTKSPMYGTSKQLHMDRKRQ